MAPHKSMSLIQITVDDAARRRYAALLWLFTTLFVGRIMAQAMQRWWPRPWLADFASFQGSSLPYPVLLTMQLLILAVMVRYARRVQCGRFAPNLRSARWLTWFGSLYMVGSLLRIGVGLTVVAAPLWFSTWIPAVFHLVLAGYVLTLALYQHTRLREFR
jgi:hypothetical protein